MIPSISSQIPEQDQKSTVGYRLSTLTQDIQDIENLFLGQCNRVKDITDQIPLWIVFEKEDLEDNGQTPVTIFDFLQKYYDWLYCDSPSGSEYGLGKRLLDLIDIDRTRNEFVKRLATVYADGIPSNAYSDVGGKITIDNVRKFIHNIRKNFYHKKTTLDGIRYFFKVLFDIDSENITVTYPKKHLLRLNGGRFFDERFAFPGGTGTYETLQNLSGSCLNFSRIQDSNFFQDYSYLLKVGIKSSYYKDTYKALAHPAGLKVIYEKTLEDYAGPQTDYDSFKICERSYLRSYSPYNIFTEYTTPIGEVDGISYFGLPYCTGCTSYGIFNAPTNAHPNWAQNAEVTGFNFKDIKLKNFFDICYDNEVITSPNRGLSCFFCSIPFQQQFDITFKYLINRYEPGWSGAISDAHGISATMQILGVSGAINPFTQNTTISSAFQYVANLGTSGPSAGWFDILTNPRNFATTVKTAYVPFERARTPANAKHRFIDVYFNIFASDIFYDQGGPSNTFFGLGPKFRYYPYDNSTYYTDPADKRRTLLSINPGLNFSHNIERILMHDVYGRFDTPMKTSKSGVGGWRVTPWMTDRYAGDHWRFDNYLMLREATTIRDLLLNPGLKVRNNKLGVLVDGVGDEKINEVYSGKTFIAGTFQIEPDYSRIGGYTLPATVGTPWIQFPIMGITWSGPTGIPPSSWFGTGITYLFNRRDMSMTLTSIVDGEVTVTQIPQPVNAPIINSDFVKDTPLNYWNNFVGAEQGICYAFGNRIIDDLDRLSIDWASKIEFIGYMGNLPYGPNQELTVPWMLYKDPRNPSNVNYTRWRLNASVSHWKNRFKSPIDGHAHIFIDASSVMERTYHQYKATGYTLWTNIYADGVSFVENIPVTWIRDQYKYTRGPSGPNPEKGVYIGVETFGQYMFAHDQYVDSNNKDYSDLLTNREQSRYYGDPKPRHWALDDDIAADLWTFSAQMLLGQRKRGLTYTNSVWGMGICGSSELGEIISIDAPFYDIYGGYNALDGYPFFYNTFLEIDQSQSIPFNIKWKSIPGTTYDNQGRGIPWNRDRRFRLFYLYPMAISLNMTVADHMHCGLGYYTNPYAAPQSGWFDKRLGNTYERDMEYKNYPVVSNIPFPGRKAPLTPPQNYWTGNPSTSEFELLYVCMKAGVTKGLDSLGFDDLFTYLYEAGATGFPQE
jgi:hypothetical protein